MQTNCGDDTQCVNKWKLCDGKVDCKDGSDESDEFCAPFVCPAAKTKCGDGKQCVVKKRVCDGKSDCNDGTLDETADFCEPDPCEAGSHMTDDGCKQCAANTFSPFGASSCINCPNGKVSAPGSSSPLDCRYEDEDGGNGSGGNSKGKGKGRGKKTTGGEEESGGGRRRGRGRGNRRRKDDDNEDEDEVDDLVSSAPDKKNVSEMDEVTTTASFTTSQAPEIPTEKQRPTCNCWTAECDYCKNIECTVKQNLPAPAQGIEVQVTTQLKRNKYNTIVIYDEDGEIIGKMRYNLRRIFVGDCVACPTPLALRQASKEGFSTWTISFKNGVLKIRNEGEVLYKRFLPGECVDKYNKAKSFAFADYSCESTYSFVSGEMEAGAKMTPDCGETCPDEA